MQQPPAPLPMSDDDVIAFKPPGRAWTVASLLLATNDALAARFGSVIVRGELSGFNRAGSGHCYFALKDAGGAPALLRCALFRRAAVMVGFVPADGQQVEARGRLGVFEGRGELQMVVESLQRLGAGALYEEFLLRRARLDSQGLFDAARKRRLAPFPRAVGVVTSLGAAALKDVVTTLARRAPHVQVIVYPSAVQGADAPAALVSALGQAGRRREVDTLLLVRGGGSMEDLWSYNDERVVHAVASCPIPVISGVGHETDVTLCDLAADVRAATPTAAAELSAPLREEAFGRLQQLAAMLQRGVERSLQTRAQRLDGCALRLQQPARRLLGQHQRLSGLLERARRAVRQRFARLADDQQRVAVRLARGASVQLQRHRLQLAATGQHLEAHDPTRVLQRGYAWIEATDGHPVMSVSEIAVGQPVRAVWADGSALAQITAIEP